MKQVQHAALALLLFLAAMSWTRPPVLSAQAPRPAPASDRAINVKFVDDQPAATPLDRLGSPLAKDVAGVRPLFTAARQQLKELRAKGRRRSGRTLPDLSEWYQIELLPGTNAGAFLAGVQALPTVEIAERAPLPKGIGRRTPNFVGSQQYLDAAPGGIDARYAWSVKGGNGRGVTIYDVEYSWNLAHEEFRRTKGPRILLDPGDWAIDPFADDNHGTAVVGALVSASDKRGVSGISWGSQIGVAPAYTSLHQYNPANAVLLAVTDGEPGDVVLLEQQYWVCGLLEFGPVEALPSVFTAIQTAVANGFIVVEAAGNGSIDLDQADCGETFNRGVVDSGAIVVGAGQPPASGRDREREWDSSYGSRVDLQGWGSGVVTTGYGDYYRNPSRPDDPNKWYSGAFAGTSSASLMVAGAVANLQGIALRRFGATLTSTQARSLLTHTGSPQRGNVSESIGPRPDLRRAIGTLFACYETRRDAHTVSGITSFVTSLQRVDTASCAAGADDTAYPPSASLRDRAKKRGARAQ